VSQEGPESRGTLIPKRERSSRVPLVQVEGLSKIYPTTRGFFAKQEFNYAVNNVSFYVRHGETLGLVGESGCGKTTLGRTVLRLHEPTLGRIHYDGVDITRLSEKSLRPFRKKMQLVFQDPFGSLNPRMTIREIVREGIDVFDLAPKAEREGKVVAMIERVGLDGSVLGRFPHELSGGQRQRVGIARALAVEPRFVVCDEPVSALDVSVEAQILNLLESIQDETAVSYLFISHDLAVVRRMSHRLAVMYLGKLVEVGSTRDVVERRAHPYTRALFAAMPSIGRARVDRRHLALVGEAPSVAAPVKGCGFFSRCPKAKVGRCDTETPQLETLEPGRSHRAACFFPEE
jgi:oligopeptide transport system ATP-binding protein